MPPDPLAHAGGSVTALESTILLPSHDREGVVGAFFSSLGNPAGCPSPVKDLRLTGPRVAVHRV